MPVKVRQRVIRPRSIGWLNARCNRGKTAFEWACEYWQWQYQRTRTVDLTSKKMPVLLLGNVLEVRNFNKVQVFVIFFFYNFDFYLQGKEEEISRKKFKWRLQSHSSSPKTVTCLVTASNSSEMGQRGNAFLGAFIFDLFVEWISPRKFLQWIFSD